MHCIVAIKGEWAVDEAALEELTSWQGASIERPL
jgi:hypothetical protein